MNKLTDTRELSKLIEKFKPTKSGANHANMMTKVDSYLRTGRLVANNVNLSTFTNNHNGSFHMYELDKVATDILINNLPTTVREDITNELLKKEVYYTPSRATQQNSVTLHFNNH